MPTTTDAAYGSWPSPISAERIAAGSIRLGQLQYASNTVYWTESRPAEKGRSAMMCCDAEGNFHELFPGFNIRTRVHEYGGGAFTVDKAITVFCSDDDRAVYAVTDGSTPKRISRGHGSRRYADFLIDHGRQRVICVAEEPGSSAAETKNFLVGLDITAQHDEQVLASGEDFYASAQISADGSQVTWLSWNAPNMPWDGTDLWVADFDTQGRIQHPRKIAGGDNESVFQPRWGEDGALYFVSDRSGWWNLYRYDGKSATALVSMEAEFGLPQWNFAMSTYDFVSANEIACCYQRQGHSHLAILKIDSGKLQPLSSPASDIRDIHSCGRSIVFIGASATTPAAVYRLDVDNDDCRQLYTPAAFLPGVSMVSEPESIHFATADGSEVHAFYYAPHNPCCSAPDNTLPPLLVKSHGGPTAATSNSLNLKIQYWTSRGFAVLDVNYRGSTGFGRTYREKLNRLWGQADVEDCVYGARYLAGRGLVDAGRMAISGSSAGGYTTLCALTFFDVFSAGASYYGVSNLESLAQDTHKFEARYLDSLVGPYPEARQRYRDRSPLYSVDQLSCPVVFLQGDEDKVVPPQQAEDMVKVLRQKGLPVAYVLFQGEQHGFRQAQNIQRALEVEYYFYSRVFGFDCADEIEPVEIENL